MLIGLYMSSHLFFTYQVINRSMGATGNLLGCICTALSCLNCIQIHSV